MIYSAKGRVLFAHVSRTAGTSIGEYLRQALPDATQLLEQHEPLVAARRLLGADFDKTFKFAMVRNPWERLVSWYALIGQTRFGDAVDLATLSDPDWEHWKNFDAFLESWSAEEFEFNGVIRRRLSQWAQLSDADGRLLTDDIGRFENAPQDLQRIFARIGVNLSSLPIVNASRHGHYGDYYSNFGRELVAQVFQDDVKGFGYRFEGPKDGATRASTT